MLSRKIAYVDLTRGTVRKEEIPLEWRQKYLGCRGINMYLLYSLAQAPMDPLSPQNPLMFGAGLLGGAPGFGSCRWQVSAVSPLCGNLGDASGGGRFGAELINAGFHNLCITGKSAKPVYLLITNDNVEIRDASHLWGKDTWETQVALKREHHDERLEAAVIGPAGENRVRYANVMTGVKDSASGSGLGAVMGSKNLKAVAVRGTKDIAVAHPRELIAYVKEQQDLLMTRKWIRALGTLGTTVLVATSNESGWSGSGGERGGAAGTGVMALYPDKFHAYSLGMSACSGCAVHCRHRHQVKSGPFATRGEGPEMGGIGGMGIGVKNFDIESVIYFSDQCNRLGLTVGVGSAMSFAVDLYQREIVSQQDTGRPLKWGDPDTVAFLLDAIAHRKGFGDILADGPYGLKKLPPEAARHMPLIKGHPASATGMGGIRSFSLAEGVATLPTHAHRNRPALDISRLPAEFLEKLYGGGPMSSDIRSYVGKARMVWWHEAVNAICDGLGYCRFQTVQNSPHAPKFEEYSHMLRLCLDWDVPVSKLWEIAERYTTTERLMLGNFGVGSRKDDGPTPQWTTQPEPARIDAQEYQKCLDEYYALHGWDGDGHPTPETIEKLGIAPARVKL